ncbi:tryptophan 7-halogenase [Collimonas humicola]|uniref:tryptophan 7-halogenase n=1 Tax=Collimonas humicola TaxID=2825886 RepID=UPI001B8C3FC2|nr:tryptophan 7-halogenase [Collimonas humicola]
MQPPLDLSKARRIVVLGAGTAGLFAALEMRRIFGPSADITVIESPNAPIVGVGEGGILNLPQTLRRLNIDERDFAEKTGAVIKLGFAYLGWKNGQSDDIFFHMFHEGRTGAPQAPIYAGFAPNWSGMLANKVPLHYAMTNYELIEAGRSQEDVWRALAENPGKYSYSFHFAAERVAEYLRSIAIKRGIRCLKREVVDFKIDSFSGHVRALKFADAGDLEEVDFLIDASGFARLVIGKLYKTPWRSFRDHLLLDRAIPFHMPHQTPHPALATRALAMRAGWMWQIPVRERIGAGYVYSSRHLTDDDALREIETTLGFPIEPMRTLRFEPGHFEVIWRGNVLAVGLASGFVEPLEATSIGVMLDQIWSFGFDIENCGKIVPQTTIDLFNARSVSTWSQIRDFLILHYDSQRRDTVFWRDIANLTRPTEYSALMTTWGLRTPRPGDVASYSFSHSLIFDWPSWLMVGQGVGAIAPSSAATELAILPSSVRHDVGRFLNSLHSSHRVPPTSDLDELKEAAVHSELVGGANREAEHKVNIGVQQLSQGQLTAAMNSFNQAAQIDPYLWQAQLNLGRLLRINRSYNEAEAKLRTAVKLRPKNEAPWRELAILLHETGRLFDAKAAFQEAISLDPSAIAMRFGLALLLQELGDQPGWTEQLRLATEIAPKSAEVWRRAAELQASGGEVESAISAFCRAVDLAGEYPVSTDFYNIARLRFTQGRFREAKSNYESAIHISPNLAEARVHLGNLLVNQKLGLESEAEMHYLAALAVKPDLVEAHYAIGLLYRRWGDVAPSKAYIEAAFHLDPQLAKSLEAAESKK